MPLDERPKVPVQKCRRLCVTFPSLIRIVLLFAFISQNPSSPRLYLRISAHTSVLCSCPAPPLFHLAIPRQPLKLNFCHFLKETFPTLPGEVQFPLRDQFFSLLTYSERIRLVFSSQSWAPSGRDLSLLTTAPKAWIQQPLLKWEKLEKVVL